MQSSAERYTALPQQKWLCPPAVRILEGKAAEHQRRKARHHSPMSNPEPQIHTNDVFAGSVAMDYRPSSHLREQIQPVVKQHEAQGQRNQHQIDSANPANHRMSVARRRLYVYRANSNLFAHSVMAFAAGLSEICGVHGRTRIA